MQGPAKCPSFLVWVSFPSSRAQAFPFCTFPVLSCGIMLRREAVFGSSVLFNVPGNDWKSSSDYKVKVHSTADAFLMRERRQLESSRLLEFARSHDVVGGRDGSTMLGPVNGGSWAKQPCPFKLKLPLALPLGFLNTIQIFSFLAWLPAQW